MRTYMWKLIDAITFDASEDGVLDVYDFFISYCWDNAVWYFIEFVVRALAYCGPFILGKGV